jgi:uncharacterized repeat protein (TIGR01451 family)
MLLVVTASAHAAGTPAGTVVQNTATVDFELAGTPEVRQSNTSTFLVAERIDVAVALLSPQQIVAPNDSNQALLFTVTNLGNGMETFSLTMDSLLAGDDFDPAPSATPIYFDTDASGGFSIGDQAYISGNNEPALAPDESVDILILNDIPGTVLNGQRGLSQLTATSMTGTGSPGTELTGQGDGGSDAIIGTSGGEDQGTGEYLVSDVTVSVVKAQNIVDLAGGAEALPGATITYTITAEVTNGGTATASIINDPIPTYTTFVPGSITLNGAPITDATDIDAGEYDISGTPMVVVRLGDLTQGDGIQTVVFEVTVD